MDRSPGGPFPEFSLFADLDEAVVAADESGAIVFVNDAAARLLGWSAVDLAGRSVETLVPERLIDSHRRGFGRFSEGRELRFTGQPLRLAARCKDGTEIEADVVLSALERAGRRAVVSTFRPVDAHATLDDLVATADELIALLRSSEAFPVTMNRLVATLGRRLGFDFCALWIPDARIDRLRCLALWERAPGAFPHFAQQTRDLAFRPDEGMIGRAWTSGVPVASVHLVDDPSFVRAAAAREDGLATDLVFPVNAEHEAVGVIELCSVREKDPDPALQRALVRVGGELGHVLRRRLGDEAGKLERARLELALDAGGMGVWHWDFASNLVTWSENVQAILGRSGDFVGSVDEFVAVLHPDDRGRVLQTFERVLEPHGPRELHVEYRVMRDDGEARWVETRGRVLTDEHGRMTVMTGVSTDTTRRKEQQLARETAFAHLDLALEAGRMGIWDWDFASGEVHVSVPLQLEFGLPPRASVEDMLERVHSDDRRTFADRIREAAESEGRFQLEARIVRPDGQVRWLATRGAAIRGMDGAVALTGVCTDVTEQRAAQARLRRKSQLLETLNEVGRAVTSNLDLERVVQMVTDAATELTGARFGAFFSNIDDPEGGGYMLYTLSGAPREAFETFPMPRNTELFAPTFAGEGIVRLDDVTRDPRFGTNPPFHGMPKGHLPVRSYLAVPVLGGDGEVYGGLFLGHEEQGRFDADAETIAAGIAAQAAVSIANARLYHAAQDQIAARQLAYEERDAVVRALEVSLLPPVFPETPDFAFGGRYVSGREVVGGDFYDVFPLGGSDWGVVVGDVCGKGPEAAAVTALARYTVRSAAVIDPEPSEVLVFLNNVLLGDPTVDRFCTVAFGRLHVLRRGRVALKLAHGGHPPALIARADGSVEVVPATGMVLGVTTDPPVSQHPTTLEAGDSIVLYTDGVTEARASGEAFGTDRLTAVVAGSCGEKPQAIADAIVDAVTAHADQGHRDDVAVLVATVLD